MENDNSGMMDRLPIPHLSKLSIIPSLQHSRFSVFHPSNIPAIASPNPQSFRHGTPCSGFSLNPTRGLLAAIGADHAIGVPGPEPAAIRRIALAVPDVCNSLPGQVPHHALLFPVRAAQDHSTVVQNEDLLHQPPAPGKGHQPAEPHRRSADLRVVDPVFNRFDVQPDAALLPVATNRRQLGVGLQRIDRNDFQPGPLLAAFLL